MSSQIFDNIRSLACDIAYIFRRRVPANIKQPVPVRYPPNVCRLSAGEIAMAPLHSRLSSTHGCRLNPRKIPNA
jgi:hypothetical protein